VFSISFVSDVSSSYQGENLLGTKQEETPFKLEEPPEDIKKHSNQIINAFLKQ
jgi:hypothetical protein